MILNEQFIKEIHEVDQHLNDEQFERTVDFSINYYVQSSTNANLKDILEIEEEQADEILNVFMRLVSYFAKFQVNDREFKANLEMVKLSEKRKQILQKKIEENQKDLKKTFDLLHDDVTPSYKGLKWRYDIQVCSKTFEEETKPKITLMLELLKGQQTENHFIETDYANLKHLHEELQLAIKAHESANQKKTKKLFI